MNSFSGDITVTLELPTDFPDGYLPTLDCKLKLVMVCGTPEGPDGRQEEGTITTQADQMEEGNNIRWRLDYRFFRKEMGSRFCVHEKSAMGYNARRATLRQEEFRRMSHYSL